jgi:hypothetical protein
MRPPRMPLRAPGFRHGFGQAKGPVRRFCRQQKLLARPVKFSEMDVMILAGPFSIDAAFRDDGPCPI